MPKRDVDGKFRTTYEVIGSPFPSVSVPTHFAKVILTAQDGVPGQPGAATSLGAFVLPNAPIPDEEPLTNFSVPGTALHCATRSQLLITC